MKCQGCGNEISDKDVRCPNCGWQIQYSVKGNYSDKKNDIIFTIRDNQENMDELWRKYKSKEKCVTFIRKKYKLKKKEAVKIVEDYMKQSGAKENFFAGCGTLIIAFVIICFFCMFCDNRGSKEDDKNSDKNNSVQTERTESTENTSKKDIQFELGSVYSENGFNINLIKADRKEMTFEIENDTDKEYKVYIYPRAINNTMETFDHAVVEKVSAGKKTQAVVDTVPIGGSYDVIKSISFSFAFYESDGSAVSFMEFESDPVVIKTNMYNDEIEYMQYDTVFSDDNFDVGCVSISDEYVEISVINNSDVYYQLNVNNASINEWTYDVNNDVFKSIYDEPIFPHTQKILKIDYNEFVKEKGISVEEFEFALGIICPNNYEKSYQTENIILKK